MGMTALIDDRVDARIAPVPTHSPAPTGWDARLDLRFERQGARTVLARKNHVGPLRVQKALYPEDAALCQAIVVHPPGGIVGGDSLAIGIEVGSAAHAQLTTPGAAKWYRSAGALGCSAVLLRAEAGATLEWLPQESLIFDGARAAIAVRVELGTDARFVGWEITNLGRTASRERFESGRLSQKFELLREGSLLWCEQAVLEGGARALEAGAILGGMPAFGTFVAAFGAVDDGALASSRSVRGAEGETAVTRLPGVLVARYRGPSARVARMYFAELWRTLRPRVIGREALPPRIWST